MSRNTRSVRLMLFLLGIVFFLIHLSGCSAKQINNMMKGLDKSGTESKSVAEQLQDQGIIDKDGNNVKKEEEDEEFIELTDVELVQLQEKLINFHIKYDKTVEDFEEFRMDFRLYAMNIIRSVTAEAQLMELQRKLDDSKFRLYDTDGDGISDFMEMMVTGTSPLRKSTDGASQDRLLKYPTQIIVFIDNTGTTRIIYPELAPLVLEAVNNGNIRPLDGQYAIINLNVMGSEVDSVRIVTEAQASITRQLTALAYVYPVTIKITGPVGTAISGDVIFMHRNYVELTQEKSTIFLVASSGQVSSIDSLSRTPTSSATPEGGKVYLDRTYYLVFAKKAGLYWDNTPNKR